MASSGTQIKVYKDDKEVSMKVCEFVVQLANDSIEKRGIFTVGVSGGSVAKFLCNELPNAQTDWSKWRMFFCDERHVEFNDPECTYTIYKEKLMSQVPLSEEHVYPDDPTLTVEEAATRYTEKLKGVFGSSDEFPRFDLLLLGMGPDGHTCSLFPGHPLLEEKSKWVASISDSPKPPAMRITLTLPVLLNTSNAVFISCGAGKASMVQRVLEGKEKPALPASLVKPTKGDLFWYLDEGAAANLKIKS